MSKKKKTGTAPAQPDSPATPTPQDTIEDGQPERTRVKVVATRMAFDGIQRIRRGQTAYVEVPVINGEAQLPKWAVLPAEWQEMQTQEAEEAARSPRRPIRGGVGGTQL
jgi:hypothetical protein